MIWQISQQILDVWSFYSWFLDFCSSLEWPFGNEIKKQLAYFRSGDVKWLRGQDKVGSGRCSKLLISVHIQSRNVNLEVGGKSKKGKIVST